MGGKQNVGLLIPSLYALYMNFYWVGAQAEWIWRGELLWQGNGKISRPKLFPRLVLELLQDEKGEKVELDVGVEYPVRLARQHDRVAPQPHHEADDQHLKLNVSGYFHQIPTQPKNPQIVQTTVYKCDRK